MQDFFRQNASIDIWQPNKSLKKSAVTDLSALKNQNNEKCRSFDEAADLLMLHFYGDKLTHMNEATSYVNEDIPPITFDVLLLSILSFSSQKTPGKDGLTSEVIKLIAETIPNNVLCIFNICIKCLSRGNLEKSYLYESPVLMEDKNSEPMLLASIMCKIMDKKIVNRINGVLEENKNLSGTWVHQGAKYYYGSM